MNQESRNQIRQEILQKRSELSVSEVFEKSKNIFRNLIEEIPQNSTNFHTFIGSIQKREVNTITFAAELLRSEKKVWIPFLDKNKEMHSSQLESLEDLVEAPFGLLQTAEIKGFSDQKFDIILVPGLQFDRKGNRIGYGKGYYDKFLSTQKETLKIGLCFDFQVADLIEAESWDIKMDVVVTETEILKM